MRDDLGLVIVMRMDERNEIGEERNERFNLKDTIMYFFSILYFLHYFILNIIYIYIYFNNGSVPYIQPL